MIKFEKISLEQFKKDFNNLMKKSKLGDLNNLTEEDVEKAYNNIVLPSRGSVGSAGYDFSTSFSFSIMPKECITLPMGIKASMSKNLVLNIYPRSSVGIKKDISLMNTVGIIDSDYYNNPDNEGHIFVAVKNNSNVKQDFECGDKIVQGIFVQFFLTDDDNISGERFGGIGSTGK